MKETMTVHKALAELKILNNRLESNLTVPKFVVANKHSNTKINGMSIADFCNQAKETYQSCMTMIERRNAIKRAVTRSNAETKVTIAGKEYTVAEAIDMKSTGMKFKETFKDSLSSQLNNANYVAERENGERLDKRVDEYIKSLYSTADMKNMSDEIKKVREDFIASQTVEIVDPLGIAKKVEQMTAEIDAFNAEVDAALSVSNALTTVEVEYQTF